jgi:serine protease Do
MEGFMQHRLTVKMYRLFIVFGISFGLCCTGTALCAEDIIQDQPLVTGLPNFAPLIEKLAPVTVNISSSKTVNVGMSQFGQNPFGGQEDPSREFFGDDFFRHFFGGDPNKEYRQQGLGSGFIIDPAGFILTNNHVIDGADVIKVKTYADDEYDATVVGTDPKTDLALLKIELRKGDTLQAANFGDSDALNVGEWVIAIGNPFGLQATVTAGIVSAKWRKIGASPYENFIQTDASINPGNSGGPLFNLRGEVVGVNSMIYSPSGGNVGIGFAIPINLASNVVQQLKDSGRVVRGWLGVVVQTVTPDLAQSFGLEEGIGALIADVAPGGPAETSGIKPGDIIIKFNGKSIREMSDLPMLVAQTPIGSKVTVTVLRDGKTRKISVKIGELKETREPATRSQNVAVEMGMQVREITPDLVQALGLSEDKGILIVAVDSGSMAGSAGLAKGDVIKEVSRNPISTMAEFNEALKKTREGNILLLVKRGRSSLWVVVKQKK